MSTRFSVFWCALLISASSRSAIAEVTPEDVRNQVSALLAERRFENDRRLESIEKLMSLSDNSLRQLIGEHEKERDIELKSIRERLDTAITSAKETLNDARTTRSSELQSQFSALKEAIAKAESSNKLAVDKAEAATEKRFESVNEFRSSLKDQQALLMPRAEADVKMKAVSDSIVLLSQRLDMLSGRTEGANALWTILATIAGLAIGIVGAMAAFARRPHKNDHDPNIERSLISVELSRMHDIMTHDIDRVKNRLQEIERVNAKMT